MKLVIISIFIITCAVQVSEANFIATATNLSERIGHLLVDINKMQFHLKKSLKGAKWIEFELKGEKLIKELKANLDKHKNEKGYHDCVSTYNRSLKALNGQLRYIVIDDIESARKDLDALSLNLTRIQNSLFGKALSKKISACRDPKKVCEITGSFTKQVISAEIFIISRFSDFTNPGLAVRIVKRLGVKEKINLIQEYVLIPVNNCIPQNNSKENSDLECII